MPNHSSLPAAVSRILERAIFFLAGSVFISGCQYQKAKMFMPALPDYPNSYERLLALKRPLREISGLVLLSRDSFASINDEEGKLYFADLHSGRERSEDFGKKGDYEDLAKVKDEYFILRSDGRLFHLSAGHSLKATYRGDFDKDMEFESLYYDEAADKLVMICKVCGVPQNSINAYRFNLQTLQFEPGTWFSISWKEIRRLAKDNTLEFRPSAAAFNPVLKKIFIIASLGKMLLQCDSRGRPEAVYRLNPDFFPQPEGLAFASNGDMYISNEGVNGKGTVLFFRYIP